MSPTVKHWLIGGACVAVILVCVVLYAVFGDTTMPGENNIDLEQTYTLASYEVGDRTSAGGIEFDQRLGLSDRQSLNWYGAYLNAASLKFNKEKKLSVNALGEKATVYSYSQSGGDLILTLEGSSSLSLDLSMTAPRVKNSEITMYLYCGESAATAVFAPQTAAISVSEKSYLFKEYKLDWVEEDTNPYTFNESNRLAESMTDNLTNSWISFKKPIKGAGDVSFYNGPVHTDWKYGISGNCVYMYPENDKTHRLVAVPESENLVLKSVMNGITETVAFESQNSLNYNRYSKNSSEYQTRGKSFAFEAAGIKWEKALVTAYEKELLYTKAIQDTGYEGTIRNDDEFAAMLMNYDVTQTMLPQTIEINSVMKTQNCKVYEYDALPTADWGYGYIESWESVEGGRMVNGVTLYSRGVPSISLDGVNGIEHQKSCVLIQDFFQPEHYVMTVKTDYIDFGLRCTFRISG